MEENIQMHLSLRRKIFSSIVVVAISFFHSGVSPSLPTSPRSLFLLLFVSSGFFLVVVEVKLLVVQVVTLKGLEVHLVPEGIKQRICHFYVHQAGEEGTKDSKLHSGWRLEGMPPNWDKQWSSKSRKTAKLSAKLSRKTKDIFFTEKKEKVVILLYFPSFILT